MSWFEAHSENYFGGTPGATLRAIREHYPISLHGVGLSLGSTDPLSEAHLGELARLVREIEPLRVSEHLSWSSVGGRYTNDLLPLPYTDEALRHMAARVTAVQELIGRQLLIENVSSYLQFTCSQLTEWDFLASLCRETGCAILLDVNNVYVNACNHGFDPYTYLDSLPVEAVQEIHLAGHSVNRVGTREIRIDTHDRPVCEAVWHIYSAATRRFPGVPALIEWDADIPSLDVLLAEARKADSIAEDLHAAAA